MSDEAIEAKSADKAVDKSVEPQGADGAATIREAFPFPRFEMPNFQMPKFDARSFSVPEGFREAAVQWVDQTRKNFDAAVTAAEEAYSACESSWSTAAKGTADCTARLTEAAHRNADAAFDLAHDLAAAKSLPDLIAISTSGVRRQLETLAAQNQEFWSLAQSTAVDTIRPLQAALPKVFQRTAS